MSSIPAQGRWKGASSMVISQARLYLGMPFSSASHAGHCKPPNKKTCSPFVILRISNPIHSRNTSFTLTAPVKVRLAFPVLQGLGFPQVPHYSPVFSRLSNPRYSVIKLISERHSLFLLSRSSPSRFNNSFYSRSLEPSFVRKEVTFLH